MKHDRPLLEAGATREHNRSDHDDAQVRVLSQGYRVRVHPLRLIAVPDRSMGMNPRAFRWGLTIASGVEKRFGIFGVFGVLVLGGDEARGLVHQDRYRPEEFNDVR